MGKKLATEKSAGTPKGWDAVISSISKEIEITKGRVVRLEGLQRMCRRLQEQGVKFDESLLTERAK